PAFADFKRDLDKKPPHKIRGEAIFLTGKPDIVPAALMHNLHHNKVLHSETVFLHLATEDIPRVPNAEKINFEKLGGGFYRIIARHGFMETPRMATIFALSQEQGLEIELEDASFYLGREKLSLADDGEMRRWRASLFLFMARNAMDASSFFGIPPQQIIEIGVRLQL
ncbi:MAG: potassium transporter Kup, partial [bacterium]